MDRNKILMKQKLGFYGLLQEVNDIFFKNPNFAILTFKISLPLFCCLLFFELWFQKVLVEATVFLLHSPELKNGYISLTYQIHPTGKLVQFIKDFGHSFLQLGLMYFPLVHLPDLVNTIGVVTAASAIYSGEKIVNFKETFSKSYENGTFKRTLITSFYVLLLTSLVFLGLLAIVTNPCVLFITEPFTLDCSYLICGLPFAVLLYKYMQWSSVWNLGIVMAILEEEKYGYVALGVSAYISRGNRRHGEVLTAVFFVWKVSLRLMAVSYVWFHQGDQGRIILITAFQVLLVCAANAIKWVIFMVFFYDCKLRFLEKKVDVEEGKKSDAKEENTSESVETGTTS